MELTSLNVSELRNTLWPNDLKEILTGEKIADRNIDTLPDKVCPPLRSMYEWDVRRIWSKRWSSNN